MVTPLCPLCAGVSQMNSPIPQTLSQNQTLHGHYKKYYAQTQLTFFTLTFRSLSETFIMDMLRTAEVLAIFVKFLPILAKICMPWQRPLDPCKRKCLLWIGWPRKPAVISNRILVIFRRDAFICIIAILVQKLVAMVRPLCPLCTRVSLTNSPIAQSVSQNQTLHGYVAYNWSYGYFCDIFAYFGQNLVAMATSLRPSQSEMYFLDWLTPKTIPLEPNILSITVTQAKLCRFEGSWQV